VLFTGSATAVRLQPLLCGLLSLGLKEGRAPPQGLEEGTSFLCVHKRERESSLFSVVSGCHFDGGSRGFCELVDSYFVAVCAQCFAQKWATRQRSMREASCKAFRACCIGLSFRWR
jgi:hypothetical protein